MALVDDLRDSVTDIFASNWEVRDGRVVPEAEDLTMSNEAVKLNATVLYADINGSTKMVQQQEPRFCAEVYKTYLHCASKIIESEDGVITAYDGDRVMAVYVDGPKNTNAVRSALKIKWAVTNIINPGIKKQYPKLTFQLRQVVGIDTSILHVARTGVRGSNDLVWVGRAANYAAKLSDINESGYHTYITKTVYDAMNDETKFSDGKSMWESRTWKAMDNISIYRSSWGWFM